MGGYVGWLDVIANNIFFDVTTLSFYVLMVMVIFHGPFKVRCFVKFSPPPPINWETLHHLLSHWTFTPLGTNSLMTLNLLLTNSKTWGWWYQMIQTCSCHVKLTPPAKFPHHVKLSHLIIRLQQNLPAEAEEMGTVPVHKNSTCEWGAPHRYSTCK